MSATKIVSHGELGRSEIVFALGLLALVLVIVAGVGPFVVGNGPYDLTAIQDRPWVLTRGTAATAIERSAHFRHKTMVRFEITQAEGFISGVCHNFEFEPMKIPLAGC
jgi:hypothetical protein